MQFGKQGGGFAPLVRAFLSATNRALHICPSPQICLLWITSKKWVLKNTLIAKNESTPAF